MEGLLCRIYFRIFMRIQHLHSEKELLCIIYSDLMSFFKMEYAKLLNYYHSHQDTFGI